MEWRHSGSPRPKKLRVQKYAGKVLTSIFSDQDGILLNDYPPKGQTINAEYYYLCWCNWSTFWRKNAAGRSPRSFCSCMTMPRLTGQLQPRRNWPTWLPVSWSPNLCSGSGSFGLPPVPWTEKQLKVRHFSTDAEVNVAVETWLDGQISEFFWVACKS